MSETEPRSIAAVGDPDLPLTAATMIAAMRRLRLSGVGGPVEYRLHVLQANDVEMVLVAMAGEGGRCGTSFRNTPVLFSGLWEGRLVAVEEGVCVDVLSSRCALNSAEWAAWMKPGGPTDRQRDPRARSMSPEQVATLKAEAEANRRACMTDVERMAETLVDMIKGVSDRVSAIEAYLRPPATSAT